MAEVLVRASGAPDVERVAEAALPTRFGPFRAVAFRARDGVEHLALVAGGAQELMTAGRSEGGALTRVHSECLTGDVAGSLRCDCGAQFDAAMLRIAQEGTGVMVYLRGQEGRGIGLAHKIAAYALQDRGLDTVDANEHLGLPVDARDYGVAAAILADLGVRRVRLLTNNPEKTADLSQHGVQVVARVAVPIRPTPDNLAYLRTKRDRMGHLLELGD